MPAIHAATVTTRNGKIATLVEHHDNGDEYTYVFKGGVIHEATYVSFDKCTRIELDYVKQKRDDDLRLLELKAIDTSTRKTANIVFETLHFDDYEDFNRRVKATFERYVGERRSIIDAAS